MKLLEICEMKNLKTKLEKKFRKKLAFCPIQVAEMFTSQLVYSTQITRKAAVRVSFLLGTKDTLAEAAVTLRNMILSSYEKCTQIK